MREKRLQAAWDRLDRKLFVDRPLQSVAHVDAPLPIGCGQTISQPSLVFEMTRLLDPGPDDIVLEVGTGSGFQTALLAMLSSHVYSVERVSVLGERARERLGNMGYGNISLRIGDGSAGWPEHAPYHRIMVTAGCAALPPPLLDQLAPGGRMVAPVGPRMEQDLLLVTRPLDGPLRIESVMKVIFVELVGPYGWSPADRG